MADAAVEATTSSSPEPGWRPRPGTSRIPSEAAILSVITLYAYFCAYLFEAGHSIPFGYPAELIGPTLYSLQGGWPVIIVFYLFGFLQLNLQYWPGYGRWTAGFVIVLVLFIAAVLTLSAFLPSWAAYIEFGSAVIAGGVNALHNRQLRRARTGQEKEPGQSMSPEFSGIFTVFDARSSIARGTIAHRLIASFGFDPLALMFLVGLIVPALAGLAGFTQAKGQTLFFAIRTPGSDQQELAVRIVGGNIVSVPFDPARNTYQAEYHLRQLSALQPSYFVPVAIKSAVRAP